MLNILQIHLHIYVLNKISNNCTFGILSCYNYIGTTNFELNALSLCRSSAEVQLKICGGIFDCAKVELLQVYCRYTLNIFHLKTDIIQRSYN